MLRDLVMIVLDFAGDLSIKRYRDHQFIRTELEALRIVAGIFPTRMTPSFVRLIVFMAHEGMREINEYRARIRSRLPLAEATV
jgi:hypothetical protein